MLAGSAGAYETVLRPLEPFDLGIFERCPIGLPVAIAGDEAILNSSSDALAISSGRE